MFFSFFEVDFESGVGLATGDELLITYDGTDYTNEVDAGAADSELMTGGDWGAVRCSIAVSTGTLDPEGKQDASKLILDGTPATTHYLQYNDVDMVDTENQTFSLYAKAAELDFIYVSVLEDAADNGFYAFFDLTDGTIASSGAEGAGTYTSGTIEDVGNGWYRCTIIGMTGNAANEALVRVYIAEAQSDVTIDGDSSSGVYLWQASYTQNSAVTNSYDIQQDRPGPNPQVALDWSDDGGHTWGHEHWADIGAIGKYGARAKWNRLGRSRNRVFRAHISDPVKVVMIDAHTEIIQGVN